MGKTLRKNSKYTHDEFTEIKKDKLDAINRKNRTFFEDDYIRVELRKEEKARKQRKRR